MIVGLAPAAHGANRTGRMFTGDCSGEFLYAALHRAGLANQPSSVHREDGLRLRDVYITAAIRCAPPDNKPSPRQLANCRDYLIEEVAALAPRCIICLGAIAWNAVLAAMSAMNVTIPRPRPRFAHAGSCTLNGVTLLGCYHVSQQNTFTGRLTPAMLDAVLRKARTMAQRSEVQAAPTR